MPDTTLRYSSLDMLGLVAELNYRRVPDVYGREMKKESRGLASIPEHEKADLLVLREIHRRFRRGDYRHTEHELTTVIAIAQRLVRKHAANEGQPEPKPVSFDLGSFTQMMACAPGRYEEAEEKVHFVW